MKTFSFAHYKVLLKVFFSNLFFSNRKKKSKSETLSLAGVGKEKARAKKVFGAILTAILSVLFVAYLVVMVASLTKIAVSDGEFPIFTYAIIGIGQLFILFLGMGTTFNLLYFSEDNELLASLPVSGATVFMAKFTVSYVSQLLISVCLLLPTTIACGVAANYFGYAVPTSFYVLSVFTPFVAPLLPLLAVTIVSIPVMYLVSFVKNRDLMKNLLSVAVSLGFMALYFVFVFSSSNTGDGETTVLPAAIVGIGRFAIFNYNWVEAMLGNDIALNVLSYLIIIVAALALIFVLSALTYKKAVSFSLEKGTNTLRKRFGGEKKTDGRKTGNRSYGFRKALFIKDLKTLISEPTLLLSLVMGVVLVPVFTVVSCKFLFSGIESGPYSKDLFSLGFVTYFVFIMLGSSNYMSLIGVSLEGKNISLIKSLPILCKDLIRGKLTVSNLYCAVVSLEAFVAFAVASESKFGPLFGFIAGLLLFVGGFGSSCYGLYCDLKKPNFKWGNMTELTKNNKKMLSRVIANIGFGFLFLIAAIVVAIVFEDKPVVAYGIFFALLAAVCVSYAAIWYNKLRKNKDELFDEIEC